MKVRVDAALCTGHGRCYALGPDVFADDERGHCVVLHETVPPVLRDQARLAAENCPEKAIGVQGD